MPEMRCCRGLKAAMLFVLLFAAACGLRAQDWSYRKPMFNGLCFHVCLPDQYDDWPILSRREAVSPYYDEECGMIAVEGVDPKDLDYSFASNGKWSRVVLKEVILKETPDDGGKEVLSLWSSRMTPAFVAATDRAGLFLFADSAIVGWKKSFLGGNGRDWNKWHVLRQGEKLRDVAPQWFALGGKEAPAIVERSGIASQPLDKLASGWLLAWLGDKSPFLTSTHILRTQPMYGAPYHTPNWPYKGNLPDEPCDSPVLLLFEKQPEQIAVESTAGGGTRLAIRNSAGVGRVMLFPVLGDRYPAPPETVAWSRGLPDAVKAKCEFWAEHLCELPSDAIETCRREADGRLTVEQAFTFERFRPGGKRLAPVPPMLLLALGEGWHAEFSGAISDLDLLTTFGPYGGIENADRWHYTVSGLDKYALERRAPAAGGGNAPARLNDMLEHQVENVLAAGHLRPRFENMRVRGIAIQMLRLYWGRTGDAPYFLSQCLEILPEGELNKRLLEYVGRECAEFPPEARDWLPALPGANRDWLAPASADWIAKDAAHKLRNGPFAYNGLIPPSNVYAIEAAFAAVGSTMGRSAGLADACWNNVLGKWHANADWATLGWLGWRRAGENFHYFSSDCLGGGRDVNSYFAGAVGLIRIARRFENPEIEALGWRELARTAALRYAMGKYGAYLDRRNGSKPDPTPGWMLEVVRPYCNGPIIVEKWESPADDARQVVMMNASRLFFGSNDTTSSAPWAFGAQIGMMAIAPCLNDGVPELGRFLYDYLPAETGNFAKAFAFNKPDWHITMAEAFQGGDGVQYLSPDDSYQAFLIRAWVMREPPEQLEKYLDVPWTRVGDFYYMHRLAEVIKAYRGVEWKEAGE